MFTLLSYKTPVETQLKMAASLDLCLKHAENVQFSKRINSSDDRTKYYNDLVECLGCMVAYSNNKMTTYINNISQNTCDPSTSSLLEEDSNDDMDDATCNESGGNILMPYW